MKRTALILAAHGSRRAPSVNADVRRHAERITQLGLFDQVVTAFHQGQPTFAEVLDTITVDAVSVVPVMISDGYYADTALPGALEAHPRFDALSVHITETVGTHPKCVTLARDRAVQLGNDHDLDLSETAVIVVGHGTSRHRASRTATMDLAGALRESAVFAEVHAGFLDDTPPVEGVYEATERRNLIVLPFLIGASHHAARDIPRRLGLDPDSRNVLPISGRVANRLVVCDAALGTHPKIAEIILARALERTPEIRS